MNPFIDRLLISSLVITNIIDLPITDIMENLVEVLTLNVKEVRTRKDPPITINPKSITKLFTGIDIIRANMN